MTRNLVLLVDSLINVLLGGMLLVFPQSLVQFAGIPQSEHAFYPSILGVVLVGIGLALGLECAGRPRGLIGLALGGAASINLCGGIVLAIWLAGGRLAMPMHGHAVLWSLVAILVVISFAQIIVHQGRLRSSGQ